MSDHVYSKTCAQKKSLLTFRSNNGKPINDIEKSDLFEGWSSPSCSDFFFIYCSVRFYSHLTMIR